MPIIDYLLPEFDQEMANTRRVLANVPDGRFDWKPHTKSFTMGALASHVATLPGWAVNAVEADSLDIAPPGQPPMKMPTANSQKELLEMFDKNVSDARKAVSTASDELLAKPWSLLAGGRALFTMPKIAVIRSFVMNHGIHHRAQLGVYLRLNDIPVPGVYGPSADDTAGF